MFQDSEPLLEDGEGGLSEGPLPFLGTPLYLYSYRAGDQNNGLGVNGKHRGGCWT